LRAAEVFDATQRAIQGHSYGRGEAASYGGDIPLEKKRDALLSAFELMSMCSGS